MSVLIFLLDTLFFFLVAAALLRAWLNGARISMAQQPGPFLMALTDWLIKPLRRGLPVAMQRSRWDVASLVAAALLALAYAGLWLGLVNAMGGMPHMSVGGGPALLLALPVLALKFLCAPFCKVCWHCFWFMRCCRGCNRTRPSIHGWADWWRPC